jgi:hypothetical protein
MFKPTQYSWSRNWAHWGCDPSTMDAYFSDPFSGMSWGPCSPIISDFWFLLVFQRLITVWYVCFSFHHAQWFESFLNFISIITYTKFHYVKILLNYVTPHDGAWSSYLNFCFHISGFWGWFVNNDSLLKSVIVNCDRTASFKNNPAATHNFMCVTKLVSKVTNHYLTGA